MSDGSLAAPLVLDNHRLYLHRMWYQERQVAEFFSSELQAKLPEPSEVRSILDQLFGEEGNNWQKIAAAVALTRQHSVISGGPGTGKTTTVARLLAALLLLEPQRLRICLAAPAGKAAARLTESLGKALHALPVSDALKSSFPQEATTLQRSPRARSSVDRRAGVAGRTPWSLVHPKTISATHDTHFPCFTTPVYPLPPPPVTHHFLHSFTLPPSS